MKHVVNRLSFIILTVAVSCAAAIVWAQSSTEAPKETSEQKDTGQPSTDVVSKQPVPPQRPLAPPSPRWPYYSDTPLFKANPSNLLAPPRTPTTAAAKDPAAVQPTPALPLIPAAPTGPNPSAALPEPITWHMTTIPLQHLRAVAAGKRVRESYPEVRVTTVEFPAQSLVVRATTEDQLVEVYQYLQGIDSPSKPIPPTKPSEPPPPAMPGGAKVIDSPMLPLPKEPATEQDAEQITAISLQHLSGEEAAKQLRLLFPEVKVASARSPSESVIIRSPSERQRMEMEAILRRIDIAPSRPASHVKATPTDAAAAKQQPDDTATTVVFRLKHADPASVALVVGQLFPKLQVAADGSSRTLITRGGETDIKDLQAIFEAIDVPPAPPQSAISFMPPGASSRTFAPGGLKALRDQYRTHEEQAQQRASQARGGAKQPVQDAFGMEGRAMGGWAKDRAGPQVTPELREHVTKAFEARQQLLRLELEQFRQRLARIEQTLEVRERLKQTIIDQRIKELVNPALEWEPTTETPGNKPAPTASNVPPSPVAATRPGVIVDLARVQRDPTGSIDELRRQVKFSIDRVPTDPSALNDAIAAAKALEEAEAMLMSQPRNVARASAQQSGMGAMTPLLERRERWQQIQKHADELYQRDLISYEASAEAHSRLQRAITQLRRAQDNRAEQIKVLTRTVSDLNEKLRLLKSTAKNPAGPPADKEKNEISLLESSIKQWEFLLVVLQLNLVPRDSDRELDDAVAGLDPTKDAEALWNSLGVRLIPDDAIAKSLFTQGLRITVVRDNSPASKAGLRKGDIILGAADWETLSDSDLWYAVQHPQDPSKLTVRYLRYSEPMTATIALEGLADAAKGKPSEMREGLSNQPSAEAKPTEPVPSAIDTKGQNPTTPGPKTAAAKDAPLGEPSKLLTVMRERYKLALDRLKGSEVSTSDVARVISDLDEAELQASANALSARQACLERWKSLKQYADDLAKNGLISKFSLLDVEAGLTKAMLRINDKASANSASAEQQKRDVEILRERVNRAMDEFADKPATIDDAIRLVEELHKAESLGESPDDLRISIGQIARWQKLLMTNHDLGKRGMMINPKLIEVSVTLGRAIDRATDKVKTRLPTTWTTPTAARHAIAYAAEALRNAQDRIDSLKKTHPGMSEPEIRQRFAEEWLALETAMKSLEQKQQSTAKYMDKLDAEICLETMRVERLRAYHNDTGEYAAERAKSLAADQRGVDRLKKIFQLYRQSLDPKEPLNRPIAVASLIAKEKAIADERLWEDVGLELAHREGGSETLRGLKVTRIRDKSPAAKAGIMQNDLVWAVEEFYTDLPVDVWDVVAATGPLPEAAFELYRDGKYLRISVNFAHADNAVDQPKPSGTIPPTADSAPASKKADAESDRWWWEEIGLELRSAPPQGRDHGVLITKVREGSPAQEAGLRVGDFVLLGDEQNSPLSHARRVSREAPPPSFPFIIGILRDNKLLTLTVRRPGPSDSPTEPMPPKPATATPRPVVPTGKTEPSGEAPPKKAPKIDRPAKVATPKTGASAA